MSQAAGMEYRIDPESRAFRPKTKSPVRWLTIEEAASRMQVTPGQVRRYIDCDALDALRGPDGRPRKLEASIEQWERCHVKGSNPIRVAKE